MRHSYHYAASGVVTTAVVNLKLATIETLTLDAQIGADSHATATVPYPTTNGVFQSSGVLQHVQVVGTDPSKPYLAVGFAMPSPTSGDVTGVVVLQCQ